MACHGGLGRTEFPGLKFDHNKHFAKGIRCESCHQEFPHTPQGLVKPKMEYCFNCHGLSHGKQGEKATGRCDACHPSGFNLRPNDHTAPWAASQHKDTNMKNPNCSMCHQASFCRDCHNSRGVKEIKLPRYKPNNAPRSVKGLRIDTAGVVTASKCVPCHGNFNREKFKTLNFKHSVHFKRSIGCEKCHIEFPHMRGRQIRPVTKIPEMSLCFKCHGLSHGNQKTFATGECSACHPSGFKLKPSSHDDNWVKSPPFNHAKTAKKDKNQCFMCHKQQFCTNCHGLEPIPHQSAWKDLHGTDVVATARKLIQPSYDQLSCNNCHKTKEESQSKQEFCAKCHKGVRFPHSPDWASRHGKDAISIGKEACYTCHRKQLCTGCHKGIQMPHPSDWLGKHRDQTNNENSNACLRCHIKNQCEECHSSHKVHNRNKQFDYTFPKEYR